ncbi:thiamine pyrophosphate-binding protein [Haladaptatus sp. DJG-WS-42]|uniref:thiamine pyrophosphate-binding protein n=1 Tax=Haladaptatus sp. DJG-WS-42 TaxID=3120516 RepID=UPI0030D246BF
MSDTTTGADLFVEALSQYGVTHLFGNPGTTELPIMEALAGSDLEYVLGIHEDVAVGMAAGYASTRRYHSHHDDSVNPLGVVNLHVTPGLAHGLGNLYDAKMTGAPLLVTAGNHERDFRHEEPILTGDLTTLADQFCKWSAEVLSVEALPTMLRRAVRVALTPPTGPVFLALPADVMQAATEKEPERLGPIPNAGGGDPAQIERAAELLTEADSPVLVLGDHVARAGEQAVEAAVSLAEASGARVHGEMLGCEVSYPTDHDQWVSFLPPREDLGTMLMQTDTLVFVGCSTNTTLMHHDEPLVDAETTCIHISQDAWQVGKNQSADAAVVGDPGLVMDAIADQLADTLSEDVRKARTEQVSTLKQSLASTMEQLGNDPKAEGETRSSKAELVDTIRAVAPDAYFVDEGVTSKYAFLTRVPLEAEQFISNKGGGLGYGLPAAIGAALAESMQENPREVIGFVGDGSYLYYPHSIYSAARYDVDLTVVVSDNRNYRILKDNTVRMLGGDYADHEFIGMDFEPAVDIPKNAESHGARGHLVSTPDDIESVLSAALDSPGTDVIDVLVHD